MKKFKPELPKRRNLLSESYAWERQAGKALPTLAEVQAAYDARMREDVDPEEDAHEYTDDADLPEPYDPNEEEDDLYEASAAKDYDGDGEIESGSKEYLGSRDKAIKAAADSTANGNYVNKARAKSSLTKKDCHVYGHDASGKATKLNSTSDVDNPKYKKFTIKTIKTESLAEAFKKRMIGNLKGSEYILSETFKRK